MKVVGVKPENAHQ